MTSKYAQYQPIPIRQLPMDEATGELSPQEKHQLDLLLAAAPQPSGISIDALKLLQASRGWIGDDTLLALAEYTRLPLAALEGVATFYNLIFRRPVGKTVLHPCDGISCDLMGGAGLRRRLSLYLNLVAGETTADHKFTLIPLPCLGACDKAPVMIANQILFERLNEQEIPALLETLAAEQGGETL
ncbi:NADH-quinone oxidoreductase subunit NuoE [Shewanella salipaludis]|nr:NADH-quinone oxidoreductase subunit NuoE [Shewanella salipaludis]